jgi:hypothetical protein
MGAPTNQLIPRVLRDATCPRCTNMLGTYPLFKGESPKDIGNFLQTAAEYLCTYSGLGLHRLQTHL